MSDRRHRKQPPTLPEGYQHGDSRPTLVDRETGIAIRFIEAFEPSSEITPMDLALVSCGMLRHTFQNNENEEWCAVCGLPNANYRAPWRAPHENAAAQLTRQSQRTGDEAV